MLVFEFGRNVVSALEIKFYLHRSIITTLIQAVKLLSVAVTRQLFLFGLIALIGLSGLDI